MIKSRLFWLISAIFITIILVIRNYNETGGKMFPMLQTSSMENLHLKHKEGDKVKWELSSQKAVLPLGNKEVFLESLVLKINQTPEIYLTSGSGIYEVDQGNVTLNKPVELKIREAVFATDSLKWNSQEELITSDDQIKLSGNSFLITGTGLSAKVQEQQVRITKDVKAIFYR